MCFGVTSMVIVAKNGETAELGGVRMVATFLDLAWIIYTVVLRNQYHCQTWAAVAISVN